MFDLLVVEEADQLTEGDFLKLARRARHLVLAGEPPLLGVCKAGVRPVVAAAGRGQYFHKLWERLHCNPTTLPHYGWYCDGATGRLSCRLRKVEASQTRHIEAEPLADAPDVELRILAVPGARPELAEVVFPPRMSRPQAKEFLFRELQEITVETDARWVAWSETPERIGLHFGPPVTCDAPALALENGVREILSECGTNGYGTCRLEFDRAAGWDRPAVEQWLEQHLRLRDLGRTALLDVPHRMRGGLGNVLADLVFPDGYAVRAAEPGDAVVDYLPVGKGRNSAREPRPPRRPERGGNGGPAVAGSGLEIDLSVPRQCERLPGELRGHLPGRGFVNLAEARAVVRKLEDLRRSAGGNGQDCQPSVAVVALFPAQAELIRLLVRQSPTLSAHAGSIAVAAPADFRQREADIVLVSLTRSHTHRAVAYGEGPAALVQALTRARQRLIVVGDPGNLLRRSQWEGGLDHLDEAAANCEAAMLARLAAYLHGQGSFQAAFRLLEGSMA